MPRLTAFTVFTLIALLSACATLPDSSAPTDTGVQRALYASTHKIDWPAQRTSITRALGSASDMTITARTDGALQLVVPAAEAFARASADLKPALQPTLDRIAAALAETPETEVLVVGHTDGLGSELHNLQLSIRRAEAITEHFRHHGIALARLRAEGRGEAEPVADNATEAGRAKNRRIEIIVTPFK